MSESTGANPPASLGRTSALMASGTFVSRILGLLRATLLAAVLGTTGLAADAFSVANTLPNQINLLVAGGMIGAVLVPQIVKASGHADGGTDFVNRLLTLALLIIAVTTVGAVLAAPALVRIFSDTTDPDALHLAVVFAYLCLPQIFFYGLYTLLGNVLNARHRFAAFMWAPVLANVVSIVGLALFWVLDLPRLVGPGAWTTQMIWVLAGTMTLSIVVQGLFLWIPLRRSGFRYRPRFGFRGVGLRSASRVAVWSLAAVAVGQLGFIVTSRVLTRASDLAEREQVVAAGRASYDYAFLLFMLPHSLITVSLTTALFVRLASAANRGDTAEVLGDLRSGLRVPVPLTVPIAVAGVLFAPLVVRVFFRTSAADTTAVSGVLAAMLLGLLPFGWLYLVNRVYYAYEDGRTPFVLQVVVTLVATAFNLIGYAASPTQAGVWVGVGQSVSNTAGAALGLVLLRRAVGPLGLAATVKMHARMVLASLVALSVTLAGLPLLPSTLGDTWLEAVIVLALFGCLYVALAWAIAHRLRVPEVAALLGPVLRRVRR